MSLRQQGIGPVPEETERVGRAAFPKGSVYMQLRDELGTVYEDSNFADLFAVRGQPGESPWRLALVTVMQYAEGMTDRQAAEAVRGRIDWKYALGLELEDAGFDYSVLSEFRARLVHGGAEQRLLESCIGRWSVSEAQFIQFSKRPRRPSRREATRLVRELSMRKWRGAQIRLSATRPRRRNRPRRTPRGVE